MNTAEPKETLSSEKQVQLDRLLPAGVRGPERYDSQRFHLIANNSSEIANDSVVLCFTSWLSRHNLSTLLAIISEAALSGARPTTME